MELAFTLPAAADGGVDRVLKKADRGGDKGSHFTGAEWLALVIDCVEACSRGGAPGDRTADHVIQLVLGGSNTTENVPVLRAPCNSEKGDETTDHRRTSDATAQGIGPGRGTLSWSPGPRP